MASSQRLCQDCKELRRFFDQARAVGVYSKQLKDSIQKLKYSKYRSLAQPLGQLLAIYARRFYDLKQFDLITYIPVHQERMEERGFNQAYLLARELGSRINLSLQSLLVRQKNTIKQSKLSRKERLDNIKNKFTIEQSDLVRNKNILIVDDIFTTGATVNAASRILLNYEAQKVKVITVATGKDIGS
ncbi:hypothetical protein JCM16358_19110 [Halanaerocella petrolearia]